MNMMQMPGYFCILTGMFLGSIRRKSNMMLILKAEKELDGILILIL